jgi:hypothetical protein
MFLLLLNHHQPFSYAFLLAWWWYKSQHVAISYIQGYCFYSKYSCVDCFIYHHITKTRTIMTLRMWFHCLMHSVRWHNSLLTTFFMWGCMLPEFDMTDAWIYKACTNCICVLSSLLCYLFIEYLLYMCFGLWQVLYPTGDFVAWSGLMEYYNKLKFKLKLCGLMSRSHSDHQINICSITTIHNFPDVWTPYRRVTSHIEMEPSSAVGDSNQWSPPVTT